MALPDYKFQAVSGGRLPDYRVAVVAADATPRPDFTFDVADAGVLPDYNVQFVAADAVPPPDFRVTQISGGWSPVALGSALYDYWDAEDTAKLTLSGSAVSAWTSSKGGYAAAQAVSAAKPVWSATSFIGRPAVTFDGADDELTYVGAGALPTGSTPCEIWVLADQVSPASDATNRSLFSYGGDGGSQVQRRLYRQVISGVNRMRAVGGNGTTSVTADNTLVDLSGRHVTRAQFLTTTLQTEVNGVAGASSAVTLGGTGSNRLRIGSTPSTVPGFFGKGPINFIAVTAPLTSGQAAQMLTYLKARGAVA